MIIHLDGWPLSGQSAIVTGIANAYQPGMLEFNHSLLTLPADATVKRHPRASRRARPPSFWERFDAHTLYYDCFWHEDGSQVLLVGPPPENLLPHHECAVFRALPSGRELVSRLHIARSAMTTALIDVPPESTSLSLSFAGLDFEIPIQPNMHTQFHGRNVLTTMNKDNRLDWIIQWVDWHARLHGADAVIVFDNGSIHYSRKDLHDAIASVDGIATTAIVDFPHRYGPVDPSVLFYPYWSNFLQMASLSILLRRFAGTANAIVNCDVDELVGRDETDAFTLAGQSPEGLITLKGSWVETVTSPNESKFSGHLAYRYTRRNPFLSICANKWVLDPSRAWAKSLDVLPGVHRIFGLDRSIGRQAPTLPFFHFKAINTNWKTGRNIEQTFRPLQHRRLSALDRAVELYLDAGKSG